MPNIKLLLAVILLASASAATALTPEEVAKIKASAASIAKNAAESQATFGAARTHDANGNANSSPSATTAQDQVGYVKGLFGVEAVNATGHPAAPGGVAGGQVRSSKYLDFQCGQDESSAKSAGGITVRLAECLGLPATGLKLAVCDAPLSGGVCNLEAFMPVTLAANRYQAVKPGLELGFSCNSAKVCRVTIHSEFSQVGTGATLEAETKDAAAAPTALAATLRDTYTSAGYGKHYETTAKAASACVQGVNSALAADGTVTTCSGSSSVGITEKSVVGDGSGETCTDTWKCLREATPTATYSKSCTRTMPLTTLACRWSVPTRECAGTRDATPFIPGTPAKPGTPAAPGVPAVPGTPATPDVQATSRTTSSCSAADLIGSDEVNRDPEVCKAALPNGFCTKTAWTVYYTYPGKATRVGDCTNTGQQPIAGPVESACSFRGLGTLSSCEPNGWWRRSLSDAACTEHTYVDGNSSTVSLTEKEIRGCGACITPVSTDVCDAVTTTLDPRDTCDNMGDAAVCGAPTSVAESTLLGRVESQRETYTCRAANVEPICVERKRVTSCSSAGVTKGTDTPPIQAASSQAVMNDALANAAVVDELSKSIGSNAAGAVPRIFVAEDSRCKKPAGFSTSYSNDCCKINLLKAGGDALANACPVGAVELAASRRANRTHFIGDYCSNSVGIGKFKKCIEKTQTYCEYTGLLSRLVQEQGREQLAAMAASPAVNPATGTLSFAYYGPSSGAWTPPLSLNGVQVTAWQTPSACKNPGSTAAALVNCPSILTQWFAACDKPSGCGDLPYTPEAGAGSWAIGAVDPLAPKLQALAPGTTVEGACDTAAASCRYTVTAIPPASGGHAVVTRSMSFYLATQDAAGQPVPGSLLTVGDILVRPYSQPGAIGSVTGPVPIEVSLDGGQTWQAATLPQKPQGIVKLPFTDLDVVGGCDALANVCSYQASGRVAVVAKPWGTAKAPDCTGFTIGQVSLLDFSKMDLSEWIASVMNKLTAPDAEHLAGVAAQEGQRYFDVYTSAPGATTNPVAQTGTAPSGAKTADVSPPEGWGPFDVVLRVTSNYPQIFTSSADGSPDPALNIDPVHAVEVEWDDCTARQSATEFNGTINATDPKGVTKAWPARGFTAKHRFTAPTEIACLDRRGMTNIRHKVRIIVHAKSGTYETHAMVNNLWTGATAPSGVNDGAGGRTEVRIEEKR